MTELRPYQRAAIDSVLDYWHAGGGNPLVDMATGTGKSIVISTLGRELLTDYPAMRALVLVHVQELVEQNFLAFRRGWPEAPAGIYSAGLGRRDAHHKITFASIQSVFRKGAILGERNVVFVDEAHLVPHAGDGMYRRLLDDLMAMDPDLRICGFSASCYRLDSGRLDQGEGRLFDEIVYSYGIGQGISDGFLSPLTSKRGEVEIDVSDVQRRGGEFVAGALEAAADDDRVTVPAVREIIERGETRRSWLVFCAGVRHAFKVRDMLRAAGVSAETITGETPKAERASIIARYKAGQIRALTNANVLTTGFDAPATDLVVMMRPTLSTGLYVQIVGRGTRLAAGKDNCLVLDFAGNCRRHGPVDAIEIKPKRQKSDRDDDVQVKVKPDDVRAKECPSCKELLGVRVARCPHCDFEFPVEPKHEAVADSQTPILSVERKTMIDKLPVVRWSCARHEKYGGGTPTLKVTYWAGLQAQNEWIPFEHSGPPRNKAVRWWRDHGGQQPIPVDVDEALQRFGELRMPAQIMVRPSASNPKYFDIVGRSFMETADAN